MYSAGWQHIRASYMAWHKYMKICASPSLTVGLNLPTHLWRVDEESLKTSIFILGSATIIHQQLKLSITTTCFQRNLSWVDFRYFSILDLTKPIVWLWPKRVLFPRDKARTSFHSREVAIIFRQNDLHSIREGPVPVMSKFHLHSFSPYQDTLLATV
jgi:hypothetical protein